MQNPDALEAGFAVGHRTLKSLQPHRVWVYFWGRLGDVRDCVG